MLVLRLNLVVSVRKVGRKLWGTKSLVYESPSVSPFNVIEA